MAYIVYNVKWYLNKRGSINPTLPTVTEIWEARTLPPAGDSVDVPSLPGCIRRLDSSSNLAVGVEDDALPPWWHTVPLEEHKIYTEDIPVLKMPEICDRI